LDLFRKKLDWTGILKLALDIYTGELKGFSNISDSKQTRESQLLPFMQQLLI